MNGSQQTKESAAQKPSQCAPAPAPPTTASNGTSSLFNKKRKKDSLKPIITNEGTGSGYVSFLLLFRARSCGCFFLALMLFFFASSPSQVSHSPHRRAALLEPPRRLSAFLHHRLPASGLERLVLSSLRIISCSHQERTHCRSKQATLEMWRGATGLAVGTLRRLGRRRGKLGVHVQRPPME